MADILEVIPQEKLQGDLPTAFVHGHVHWLNLSTLVIEIRPLEKIWEHSLDNWRIECATGQYRMYKGRECLVDVHSPTWEMVSRRLKPLDTPENLIITTVSFDTPQSSPVQLSVALPRYSLSFFINEDGELESRDFKDMVYDENQCIGTLFGLENQLVLRANVQVEDELVHKRVIIPEGHSSRARHSHQSPFAKIDDIPPSPQQPVTYHTYRVDTDLGCLAGYTNWRNKLYLAQLHVKTSVDWMPDPLTGRTGIQEALRLLRSAGCRSIRELDTCLEEPELLSSPHYKIYPQISFAIGEINYLIQRERFLHANQHKKINPPTRPQLDVKGALQAAYLFPFEDAVPNLPIERKEDLTNPLSETETEVHTLNPVQSSRQPSNLPSEAQYCTPVQVTLSQLLLDRSAPNLPALSRLRCCGPPGNRPSSDSGTHTLNQLFSSIRMNETDPSFQKQYISRLHDSARHAREASRGVTGKSSTEGVQKHYVRCRENYMTGLTVVKKELGPMVDLGHALNRAGQWPQITPNTLFPCLSSTSPIKLPEGWKQCLVSLALLLVELQRSRRLLQYSLDNLEEEFSRELENEGCYGWSAEEYPDWLLTQVRYSWSSIYFC